MYNMRVPHVVVVVDDVCVVYAASNRVRYERGDGFVQSVSSYTDGAWHHAAVTMVSGGVHTLYVDGASQGTLAAYAITDTGPLAIGTVRTCAPHLRSILHSVGCSRGLQRRDVRCR